MVRIINYKERTSEEGDVFYVLEVQGGIEMVKSQQTGQFYATARKTSIVTTFDELTCQALIGTEMPGRICKIECEPYEYTIKDTGEIITLSHKFIYEPEQTPEQETPKSDSNKHSHIEKTETTVDSFMTADVNKFSKNGHLQEA